MESALIKKFLGYNIIFQNYINHGRNYIPQKPAQNYTKLYKIIQKLYRSQKNSGQAVKIYQLYRLYINYIGYILIILAVLKAQISNDFQINLICILQSVSFCVFLATF